MQPCVSKKLHLSVAPSSIYAQDGVKGCSCGLDKRMEMTKLHMVATGVSEANLDSDRPFKVPRLTPSSAEM